MLPDSANRRDMAKEELNRLGGLILDVSIAVHRELGPGLLESAMSWH